MRAMISPLDGQLVFDPDGDLEVPVQTLLRHRLRVEDGVVIDLYDGLSDEEVSAWDGEHPDQLTPSGRYLSEAAERQAKEKAEAEAPAEEPAPATTTTRKRTSSTTSS